MNRWQWYTGKIRRFGDSITPTVENLSLESLKRFKQEPALWIGAAVAVFVAGKDVAAAGADGWTIAGVAVVALGGFVTRQYVSPANVAGSE